MTMVNAGRGPHQELLRRSTGPDEVGAGDTHQLIRHA